MFLACESYGVIQEIDERKGYVTDAILIPDVSENAGEITSAGGQYSGEMLIHNRMAVSFIGYGVLNTQTYEL